MHRNVTMKKIKMSEQVKEKGKIRTILEKSRKSLLPIFVSHLSSPLLEEEHLPIRNIVERLQALWLLYIQTEALVCVVEGICVASSEGGELSPPVQAVPVDVDESIKSLAKISEEIKIEARELGMVLVDTLKLVESLNFGRRYSEFCSTYQKMCDFVFSILYVGTVSVSAAEEKRVAETEYRAYKCLFLCEKIHDEKSAIEKSWISPSRFPSLKFLYEFCVFSLFELCATYKIAVHCAKQQEMLISGMECAQKTCLDFLSGVVGEFSEVVKSPQEIYGAYSLDKKIYHHKSAIIRRRGAAEDKLKQHKKKLAEINILNWEMGKEAKNIVNMERNCVEKGNLPIKNLFFLFEDIEKNLKKTKSVLASYGKVFGTIKKTYSSELKLFSMRSLDFRHMRAAKMLEGLPAR